MKKTQGKLVPLNQSYQMLFDMFIEKLTEGQPVYVFLEGCESNSTIKQKRLLNLNIRKIAEKTGQSFNYTKEMIKKDCGLEYKSTEDLSSDEINLMFEKIREICNIVDIPFI